MKVIKKKKRQLVNISNGDRKKMTVFGNDAHFLFQKLMLAKV